MDTETNIETIDRDITEEHSPASLLQRAAKHRDETKAAEEFHANIPTWGGDMRGIFKVVDRDEITKLAQQVRLRARTVKNGEVPPVEVELAFLARACTGYEVLDPETDKYIELGNWKSVAKALKVDRAYKEDQDTPKGNVVCERETELMAYLIKYQDVRIAAFSRRVAGWIFTGEDEATDAVGEF